MKTSLFAALFCAILILLIAAGCTQNAQPPVPPTPVSTPFLTETTTGVPISVTKSLIPPYTMIGSEFPLPTTIKDSQILFTISAPVGFAGTTIRTPLSEHSILYKTTIYNPAVRGANATIYNNSGNYLELADSLTIFSYSSSLNADQNIRNKIRDSGSVFTESSVTYNGINYTRFDALSDPYSGMPYRTVIFAGKKSSANERGYLPVMIYTMTPDSMLNQATIENMVKSFQYYTGRNISAVPGVETDKLPFYQ